MKTYICATVALLLAAQPVLAQDKALYEQVKAHGQAGGKYLRDADAAEKQGDFKTACELFGAAEAETKQAVVIFQAFSDSFPTWPDDKRAEAKAKVDDMAFGAYLKRRSSCEAAKFDARFQAQMAPIVAELERSIQYTKDADADFARGDADGAMAGYYSALIILPDLVLTPLRDMTAANIGAAGKQPVHNERTTAMVNKAMAQSSEVQAKIKKTCLTWPNNFKGIPYSGICETMTR
ncbi:hypothetical protein ABI_47200 [Asticcacaulis biprosthecium C19]|uniref:Uncharacterized protein n=1 Tax=Asticcacaulis biprosthecium C19 TaxID=715226 RepID=F4QU72_9CAUL|nr:hypothetical protein [Asticcacaulis biprosthecium]EGF89372.1 hypothetical protein ABI_47200 [Asticcacaulis biprosthecium C19]